MAATTAIDIPALIERQKIGWFQLRALFLCFAVVTFDGYDAQIVGFVTPALAQALHAERAAFGPAFSAGFLGLLLGAFVFGVLADYLGRRRVIIACTLVFGAFSLLTLTSGTLEGLIAWRFLTGLGIGGAVPNSIALIAEYAPQRRRATMTTFLGAGVSLGAAGAGWLTALLLPRFGWTALFYVGGILPLALTPLLLWALPESLRFLVLQRRPARKIGALVGRLAPTLRGAQGAEFIVAETRREGLPVRHLLSEGRGPLTLLMWTGFLLNLLAIYSLIPWLPTVLGSAGLDVATAALVASMFSTGGIFGAVAIGSLMDRFGAYRVLGATFVAAALLLLALSRIGPFPLWLAAVVFGAGLCTAGGQHGANAHAGDFYPTFMRSTGVSWAMGIGRIGAFSGPLLLGALLAWHWALPAILAVYAATTGAAAAAFLAMGWCARRRRMKPLPAARGTEINLPNF